MLRMNESLTDYEIDRELTGKRAIQSNARLQDKIKKQQKVIQYYRKEKKKLKEELDRLREKYGDIDL